MIINEVRSKSGVASKLTGKIHKEARPLKESEKIVYSKYWGDQKIDGYWSLIFVDNYGLVSKIESRTGRDVSKQKGYNTLINKKLPPNSVFVGEFVTNRNKMYIFDTLMLRGIDVRGRSFKQRRAIVEKIKTVPITKIYKTNLKRAYLNEINRGNEGLILKNSGSSYNDDDWIKWKNVFTVDYIIAGFTFNENKKVKAIKLGIYEKNKLEVVGKVGVMKPALREQLSKNPKKYIGMVIEIKGNGLWRTLAMKHPSVVRLRPDLPKKSITSKKYKDYPKIGEKVWEKYYKIGLEYIRKKRYRKAEIVGSIIRAKNGRPHPTIKDIDIVALIKPIGKRVIRDVYKEIPINIFVAHNIGEYRMTKLHFALGKGIIAWKRKAKEKGFKLTRYGLFKNGVLITTDPKKVMKILGVKTKVEGAF